jgi:hypothetical protein
VFGDDQTAGAGLCAGVAVGAALVTWSLRGGSALTGGQERSHRWPARISPAPATAVQYPPLTEQLTPEPPQFQNACERRWLHLANSWNLPLERLARGTPAWRRSRRHHDAEPIILIRLLIADPKASRAKKTGLCLTDRANA